MVFEHLTLQKKVYLPEKNVLMQNKNINFDPRFFGAILTLNQK